MFKHNSYYRTLCFLVNIFLWPLRWVVATHRADCDRYAAESLEDWESRQW